MSRSRSKPKSSYASDVGLHGAVERQLWDILKRDSAKSEIGAVGYLKLEGPTEEAPPSKGSRRSVFTARVSGGAVSIAIPVEVEWQLDSAGKARVERVTPDGSAYGLRLAL